MSSETSNLDGPWMALLQSRPVRNVAARVEEHTDGRVVIYVRQKKPGFLVPPLSWIVPYKRERSAYLDRVGTRLWRMCDGEHTVEEIVDAFRGQYRLTFHESRAAVMGYLKLLTERGVVAIVTQEDT
jgi:hypothetical protein